MYNAQFSFLLHLNIFHHAKLTIMLFAILPFLSTDFSIIPGTARHKIVWYKNIS